MTGARLAPVVRDTLNTPGFIVGYWGTSIDAATVGIAAPTAGRMIGSDGRAYDGVVRHEPFDAARHAELANTAAHGIRRTMDGDRRRLVSRLVERFDVELPEAVTIVARLPDCTVSGLLATPLGGGERGSRSDLKALVAGSLLMDYDFGDDVRVVATSGFGHVNLVGGALPIEDEAWVCRVFVRTDDAPTVGDSERLHFTVRFSAGTAAPAECFARDEKGNDWGSLPGMGSEPACAAMTP